MDNIFGLKTLGAQLEELWVLWGIEHVGLGKLPVGASRFCLVRLDENDNLFMTGGWRNPKKIYLYR